MVVLVHFQSVAAVLPMAVGVSRVFHDVAVQVQRAVVWAHFQSVAAVLLLVVAMR